MQDELEDYVRNYCIGLGDTERRQESVSKHTTAVQQMKTVRYSSMAVGRRQLVNARQCHSQVFTVKQEELSRQSVCTRMHITEDHKESREGAEIFVEPESEQKIQSIIFNESDQIGESTTNTAAQPPALKKPVRRHKQKVPLALWKRRLIEAILAVISVAISFLGPSFYSFARSIFISEESYKFTYRPSFPSQVKLAVPLFIITLGYFILMVVYFARKFLHRQTKIKTMHMHIAVGVYAVMQLLLIFSWLEGVKLGQQVYERFQYDSNYQDRVVVVFLLRWRLLWISNTLVFLLNVAGLAINMCLTYCKKKHQEVTAQ